MLKLKTSTIDKKVYGKIARYLLNENLYVIIIKYWTQMLKDKKFIYIFLYIFYVINHYTIMIIQMTLMCTDNFTRMQCELLDNAKCWWSKKGCWILLSKHLMINLNRIGCQTESTTYILLTNSILMSKIYQDAKAPVQWIFIYTSFLH